MKFLFDFLPIILFFIAFKIPEDPQEGIMLATGVAIIVSIAQVGYSWFRHHKVEKMHLITMGLIVVLGGATLLLQDERFIKWKPTAVNWLFSIVFLGSQYFGSKNIIKRMMDEQVSLPEPVWGKLNLAWALFFFATGCANLYVAFNYPTEIWVNFKLFGILGLTVLFVIAQALYLSRYIEEEPETAAENESDIETSEEIKEE